MSRKIKLNALHFLFKIFSFLADKTGGWTLFVKPKLIIGSLILGLGITACNNRGANSSTQNNSSVNKNDSIESLTKCYEAVSDFRTDTISQLNNNKKSNYNHKNKTLSDTIVITESCYIIVQDTNENDSNSIYEVVEQMPQFHGGDKELFKYLNNSINYVNQGGGMCYNQITGRVICRFVVEKDGSIGQVEVVRSLEPSMDKEAVRVIRSMPKWIPGKQDGKPVRVWFLLPINFTLQ
mgnify:FL=1|jgi:TonB family protein